jgi:hypothetical protein
MSEDLGTDPHPDPYQNVMDPEHCFQLRMYRHQFEYLDVKVGYFVEPNIKIVPSPFNYNVAACTALKVRLCYQNILFCRGFLFFWRKIIQLRMFSNYPYSILNNF